MSQKCVHKGCGKKFEDPEEECIYHPGPPIFHEGQKGWSCCKPRVLTFDEFLSIPPCTTGQHSTVEEAHKPEPAPKTEPPQSPATKALPKLVAEETSKSEAPVPHVTQAKSATEPTAPPDEESESDDVSQVVPKNVNCKRRGCNTISGDVAKSSRDGEKCVYHPGHPLFHEGSKGWTCCKRRVLEFDEFLKIEGCRQKSKHLYIGKKESDGQEEQVREIRHDFYQTATTVIASLFLKKVDKARAKIEFTLSNTVSLDLHTLDNKRYKADVPLFGAIEPSQSSYKIMGTKVELSLVKRDGASWPVLRSDEQNSKGIVQVGQPASA